MSSHSKLVRKSFPMLVWLMLYDPAQASGERDSTERTVGNTMVGFIVSEESSFPREWGQELLAHSWG